MHHVSNTDSVIVRLHVHKGRRPFRAPGVDWRLRSRVSTLREVDTLMDTMAEALRAAAGPELFHRNAFRITGLPTTADRIAVHRRHEQASVAGHPADVDAADVRDACERLLEDLRRRLIDELFWLWDITGADCKCSRS